MNCYPKPIGCGREISLEEYVTWDRLSQDEYQISMLCLDPCQNSYFSEDDEEPDYFEDAEEEDGWTGSFVES